MKKSVWFFIVLTFFSSLSLGWEDPTNGKPFVPWLWKDQLEPTIKNSYDSTGLAILVSGAAATVVAHQYDDAAFRHNYKEQNLIMNSETSDFLGWVGNGQFGIATALLQIVFDQDNGLKHSRAIMLTAASHITLATAVGRERPSGRNNLSFPSGHGSSAFATATSLAYAYGWKAGVPAYLLATAIGASRVSQNTHWVSDVVSGAALGIYWARASALTSTEKKDSVAEWTPVPLDGGLLMNWTLKF